MNGHQRFENLIADSGALISVSGVEIVEGRFAKIAFAFDHGALLLQCNDDTDEINVQVLDAPPEFSSLNCDLLSGLIGLAATDAWSMTNHRGYLDAFQLRFIASDRTEQTCQFEVVASAIDVYRVGAD